MFYIISDFDFHNDFPVLFLRFHKLTRFTQNNNLIKFIDRQK